MYHLPLALLALLSMLTIARAAPNEEFPKEIIVKGKTATALALLPENGGSGSAFCIDKAGFFATNEHVVRGLTPDQKLTLVLNSGEDDEKVLGASVVRKCLQIGIEADRREGVERGRAFAGAE
jgi:S1-C subfamily serine protease